MLLALNSTLKSNKTAYEIATAQYMNTEPWFRGQASYSQIEAALTEDAKKTLQRLGKEGDLDRIDISFPLHINRCKVQKRLLSRNRLQAFHYKLNQLYTESEPLPRVAESYRIMTDASGRGLLQTQSIMLKWIWTTGLLQCISENTVTFSDEGKAYEDIEKWSRQSWDENAYT